MHHQPTPSCGGHSRARACAAVHQPHLTTDPRTSTTLCFICGSRRDSYKTDKIRLISEFGSRMCKAPYQDLTTRANLLKHPKDRRQLRHTVRRYLNRRFLKSVARHSLRFHNAAPHELCTQDMRSGPKPLFTNPVFYQSRIKIGNRPP